MKVTVFQSLEWYQGRVTQVISTLKVCKKTGEGGIYIFTHYFKKHTGGSCIVGDVGLLNARIDEWRSELLLLWLCDVVDAWVIALA